MEDILLEAKDGDGEDPDPDSGDDNPPDGVCGAYFQSINQANGFRSNGS